MLTPNFLRDITDRCTEAVSKVNQYLINRVTKRILNLFESSEEVDIIPASVNDIRKLKEAGLLMEDIENEIAKRTPMIANEVKLAFDNVKEELSKENVKVTTQVLGEEAEQSDLEQAGKFTAREKNLMDRAFKATNGEIRNLTRTTAEVWQEKYIQACDDAYFKATHGVSMNQAVREAIDEVAKWGTHVRYPSGHVDTIEVAIARAVRTGVNQASAHVTLQRCADSGANHVVVSSHLGARTTNAIEPANHASWQGKVYSLDWKNPVLQKFKPDPITDVSTNKFQQLFNKMKKFFQKNKKKYPDFVTVTGYGTGEGLSGWNCRHNFFLFYPDINENNQTQYGDAENEKAYALSQEQRAKEREIRKTKRILYNAEYALKETKNKKTAQQLQAGIAITNRVLQRQLEDYSKFCKAHDLKELVDRLYVARTTGVPNYPKVALPGKTVNRIPTSK